MARGAGRCRRPDASATRGRQGRRSPLPARRPAGSPRRSPGCPRPALPTSNRHLRPRTPGCQPSIRKQRSLRRDDARLAPRLSSDPSCGNSPADKRPLPPGVPPALSGFPAGTEPVPSAPRGPGTRRERGCGAAAQGVGGEGAVLRRLRRGRLSGDGQSSRAAGHNRADPRRPHTQVGGGRREGREPGRAVTAGPRGGRRAGPLGARTRARTPATGLPAGRRRRRRTASAAGPALPREAPAQPETRAALGPAAAARTLPLPPGALPLEGPPCAGAGPSPRGAAGARCAGAGVTARCAGAAPVAGKPRGAALVGVQLSRLPAGAGRAPPLPPFAPGPALPGAAGGGPRRRGSARAPRPRSSAPGPRKGSLRPRRRGRARSAGPGRACRP